MYYKNVPNSIKSKDPNNFANRFLNNKNNLDENVQDNKQKENSSMKLSKKDYMKDQTIQDTTDNLPYKRVNKGPPLQKRSKIDPITERNDKLNTSYDNILRDSKRLKNRDENEVTFGNSLKKHNRVSSMNNMNIDYNKLICNNCLNTQLSTVRKLKNKEDTFMNNSQELVCKFVRKSVI